MIQKLSRGLVFPAFGDYQQQSSGNTLVELAPLPVGITLIGIMNSMK